MLGLGSSSTLRGCWVGAEHRPLGIAVVKNRVGHRFRAMVGSGKFLDWASKGCCAWDRATCQCTWDRQIAEASWAAVLDLVQASSLRQQHFSMQVTLLLNGLCGRYARIWFIHPEGTPTAAPQGSAAACLEDEILRYAPRPRFQTGNCM